MKHLKSTVIAIVFLVVGFLLGQSWQLPRSVVNQAADQTVPTNNRAATYFLQFADNEITEFQEVEVKANQTVLDMLIQLTAQNKLDLQTKDYGSLGILVIKIGDKTNGQNNQYWQYFVNGQQPMVGADKYVLNGGETVEWKFIEDQGIK